MQNKETNWLDLEKNSCPEVPLESLPFLERKSVKKLKTNNEWMKCTLKVWFLVREKMKAPLTMSRAMQTAKNVEFLPNKLDTGANWANKGLVTIDQLFEGDYLKSFTQLREVWFRL